METITFWAPTPNATMNSHGLKTQLDLSNLISPPRGHAVTLLPLLTFRDESGVAQAFYSGRAGRQYTRLSVIRDLPKSIGTSSLQLKLKRTKLPNGLS